MGRGTLAGCKAWPGAGVSGLGWRLTKRGCWKEAVSMTSRPGWVMGHLGTLHVVLWLESPRPLPYGCLPAPHRPLPPRT